MLFFIYCCIGNSIFSRYNAGDGLEGVQALLPRGDSPPFFVFTKKTGGTPEGLWPLWKVVLSGAKSILGLESIEKGSKGPFFL